MESKGEALVDKCKYLLTDTFDCTDYSSSQCLALTFQESIKNMKGDILFGNKNVPHSFRGHFMFRILVTAPVLTGVLLFHVFFVSSFLLLIHLSSYVPSCKSFFHFSPHYRCFQGRICFVYVEPKRPVLVC